MVSALEEIATQLKKLGRTSCHILYIYRVSIASSKDGPLKEARGVMLDGDKQRKNEH